MKPCPFWPPPSKFLIFFPKKTLSEKFLMFSQKKAFLIFVEIEPTLSSLSLRNKKNSPRENFLYFRKQKP